MSETLEPGRGGFNSSHREMHEMRWPVSPRTVFGQTDSLLQSILQEEADAWLRPNFETEATPLSGKEMSDEARRARFEQFTQAARVTSGQIQRAMQTMEYQLAASSIEDGELPGRDGVDLLRSIQTLSQLEQAFSQEAAFYAPEDES